MDRQYVGIDFHRRRSVIVRLSGDGDRLGLHRIVNDPYELSAVMARCGIGQETTVVAYADRMGNGPFRLWWACRVYGHEDVVVLDGGFDKWIAEGLPISNELPPRPPPAEPWTPRHGARPVAGPEEVMAGATDDGLVVLDSRPREQFEGRAVWFEEGAVPAGEDGIARTSRGEIRAGHVPWARSIPWPDLYRAIGRGRR